MTYHNKLDELLKDIDPKGELIRYEFSIQKEDLRDDFTEDEKRILRPIAETLAMLDGNAFFTYPLDKKSGKEWYEQYLIEAFAIWNANGGIKGWAGEVSWVKEMQHDNPAVKEAWDYYQILKKLTQESK